MMKNLIVYMSHHGTTRKLALRLAHELGDSYTQVVDLRENRIPDLSQFETIIIGGSIRFGQVQKGIQKFCRLHQSTLLQKRLGLFICAIENYEMKKELEESFPEPLRNHALACSVFGGELLFDQMNLVEKLFTKTIYGINATRNEINEEAIQAFIIKIKS